jgi:hypothetical protein
MIIGWVPIFREVWSKLIGGDLDVDDKGSEQHRFEPVQSLHHGSVGYQPMHTWISLAKEAMSLQANQEHKQEQKEQSRIADEWLAHESWGLTNRM